MRTLTTSLFLLLATMAGAQVPVFTESERAPGRRALQLHGFFQDADSAYMQVYHDGEAIYDEVFGNTFQVTLQSYDDYTITFTDARQRVKRISIHELSDDMIEFYPPLEIDFSREGNLVLIKASNGKPDFLEFDVGMSRKRR